MQLSITFLLLCIAIHSMCIVTVDAISFNRNIVAASNSNNNRRKKYAFAAVMPGSPLIVGTITQGTMNGISLYSNILLARFALSWFPQILAQFPILRPIITVTEPYLQVFRKTIPPIGGFDISALPAIFILDILSQTTAAIGDDRSMPTNSDGKKKTVFNIATIESK